MNIRFRSARKVRRDACKAIDEAAEALVPGNTKGVHEARKQLKKARAAMRLLRAEVGPKRYRAGNEALRDAAKSLTAVRNAKVLLDTLDDLHGRADRYTARGLADTRPALERRLGHAQSSLGAHRVAGIRRQLHKESARLARLAVGRHAGAALRRGVTRVYRAGRRAMAKVRRKSTTASLHEWRKQVKYLSNQFVLLDSDDSTLQKMRADTHTLGHELGKDHDVAMFLLALHRNPGRLTLQQRSRIEALATRRRREIQARIMNNASAIYGQRARQFASKILR